MGGKNHADNSSVVDEQKAEAAQEAQKEAARQQRIQQGLASIKAAFEGSEVMGTKSTPFDWSSFKPGTSAIPSVNAAMTTGVPAGYTATYIPGTPTTTTTKAASTQQYEPSDVAPGGGGASSQYAAHGLTGNAPTYGATTTNAAPTTTTSAGVWGLKDASGKTYKPGDALNVDTQYDTGQHSGGFDDAFYNKYKQSVLDYYQPQVDKQYADAKKQAVYGLGRSGNLISSAANDLNADLQRQNDINVAGIRNQADTAAGDLRSQVNTEEQKATSQLYATEDPEVAAQQSLASVRDISLQQPQMSPLSALFNVATIGGANVLKGYQGQQNLNAFTSSLPTGSRSSSIVK